MLSLACDTILNIPQEVFLFYPHRFQLFHSPQHSWGIRLFIQITQTIQQIELLDSQLDKTEAEMMDTMKFNDSVIMTIPCIGYINGGMILDEIGDIHRFSNPNKLLAFADLDPSVYQSDNFSLRQQECPNVARVFYATLLQMQFGTLSELLPFVSDAIISKILSLIVQHHPLVYLLSKYH